MIYFSPCFSAGHTNGSNERYNQLHAPWFTITRSEVEVTLITDSIVSLSYDHTGPT